MKVAADFRKIARNALKGKWGIAVLAGVLASMLGAISTSGPEIEFNLDGSGANASLTIFGQQIELNDQIIGILLGALGAILALSLVMAAFYLIVGSVVGAGYAKFNLDLVDGRENPEIATMFGYFKHWKTTTVASLLQTLYVMLWSLLFVIPGIYAGYGYAMTSYILAENPEISASEAIARSKEMMHGNRWRLFCMSLSFIGWDILCGFTFGIGYLWLTPYKQAATAAFYREVSGTERMQAATPAEPVQLRMEEPVDENLD